jgi:hypothetical protein
MRFTGHRDDHRGCSTCNTGRRRCATGRQQCAVISTTRTTIAFFAAIDDPITADGFPLFFLTICRATITAFIVTVIAGFGILNGFITAIFILAVSVTTIAALLVAVVAILMVTGLD